MDMETKLTFSQRRRLYTIYWKLVNLRYDLDESDFPLNYGYGSVV